MANLLVPIQIEATIENKFNEDNKRIGHVLPEFNCLCETALGDSIETTPFSRSNPLEAGIHLHFILPDALTHGKETAGVFQYPNIPNRWLITRVLRETQSQDPVVKRACWIVESDYIGMDNSSGVPMPNLDDKEQPYRFLGRSYSLGSPAMPGTYLENLTVFGAGDPTFASFYPSCRSVLGFYDPLSQIPNAMLSYSIIGWYLDPIKDPLHHANSENWTELLEQYGWDCDAITGDIPTSILCHGMVCGLEWKGDSSPYPSSVPQGSIDVTIGNTSQEALSALISRKLDAESTEIEMFTNALQYDILNLLNEQDGAIKVKDEIHKRAFSTKKSGYLWRITPNPDHKSNNSKPKLTRQGNALLLALNEAQKDSNRCTDKGERLLEELFYAWHAYLLKYENPPQPRRDKAPFREDIYNRFQLLSDQITENNAELSAVTDKVQQAKQALEKYICENEHLYIIEKTGEKDYMTPNPPVFLFSGDGLDRSFLFGESGRFQNGRLLCREDKNIISKITIPLSQKVITLESVDLLPYFEEIPNASLLPDCFDRLFLESILLDDKSARFLAIASYKKARLTYSKSDLDALDKIVEQLILAPWDGLTSQNKDVQTLANQVFEGRMPSKIAVNFWTPPFHTLFLEWSVIYLPTRTDNITDNSMDGWEFNGLDYTYKRNLIPTASAPVFSGRAVITPHSQYILKDALQKQIERYRDKKDITELLEKLGQSLEKLAILSQNLGGFTEQLLSLKPSLCFPFVLTNSNLWTDERAVSMTTRLNAIISQFNKAVPEFHAPVNTEYFFPIRAAFLKPLQMVLLDTFGRSQLLSSSLDQIHVSESLRPDREQKGTENTAMLSPRISQNGRFTWEYIPVTNTSPVIGFIVLDLLNRGLMIFDSDGTMLGGLHVAYNAQGQHHVIWQSTPFISPFDFNQVPFSNMQLKNFAVSLKDAPLGSTTRLETLMDYIDKRQCEILQEGQSNPEDISVLCGRPIALFQAKIILETSGGIAVKHSLESFGTDSTLHFEDVPFLFHMGDSKRRMDGFIGYYEMHESTIDYGHLRTDAFEMDLNQNRCKEMLCLAEPPGNITVKSGIYPVESIRLPEEYYTDAIQNMYMAFEVNPVISQEDRIAIPFDNSADRQWSFAYRTKVGYREQHGIASCLDSMDEKPNCIIEGFVVRRNSKEDSNGK